MKIFVDGNEQNDKLYIGGSIGLTDYPLRIGGTSVGGKYPFNGIIDEVRIYNRALSGDKVKAPYENSILVQPGETATLTHACTGRCRYNLVMGGMAKETMVKC